MSSTCFTDVAHFKDLGSSINGLRLNDELCDITLLVGNKPVRAHKVILAAASPYFRAMFTGKSFSVLQVNVQNMKIVNINFMSNTEQIILVSL